MTRNLDLIINGNIITMVNQNPRAQAVGVKNGLIAAVGSVGEVEKGRGKSTQVLEFKDQAVLPGFIDSHTHPMEAGKNNLGVDLSFVSSISDTLAKIQQRAQVTSPGKWIFCSGFNRLSVKEKRFPSKKELDGISGKHPISILHYDGHFSMLNSASFQALQFSTNEEGIVKDIDGEPTGLVEDPAIHRIHEIVGTFTDDAERLEAISIFAEEALEAGITTVHAKETLDHINFISKNLARLPVRIKTMIMCARREGDLDQIISSQHFGDPVCVANVADGSIEGHTAALFEPYADDRSTLGMLYFRDDELYDFVEKAHRAGFQISIHAESDRSINQVLSVYEKVIEKYPRQDHRHRIEHFELPTVLQIKRVAKLGVALAMQPQFITVCEGPNQDFYRTLLGEERVRRTNPLRSILDEGCLVSGGSDTPVTRMNPLAGIQACVTQPVVEQRIDVYEAIELYTINGAKIGFEEDKKGSIEVGKLADFVILSDDPYCVPCEKIDNIDVEMTIVGGKVVYKR